MTREGNYEGRGMSVEGWKWREKERKKKNVCVRCVKSESEMVFLSLCNVRERLGLKRWWYVWLKKTLWTREKEGE
jgi:hypothetical protein